MESPMAGRGVQVTAVAIIAAGCALLLLAEMALEG